MSPETQRQDEAACASDRDAEMLAGFGELRMGAKFLISRSRLVFLLTDSASQFPSLLLHNVKATNKNSKESSL